MKRQIILVCALGLVLLMTLMGAMTVIADQSGAVSPGLASMLDGDGIPSVSTQAVTNTITQYGITWIFDRDYESGQFANGDYWVVGPVTITRITPDFDGLSHGWEVNPTFAGGQGFDGFDVPDTTNDCSSLFDAALVPDLPYVASPGESIVKGISGDHVGMYECLQTAAVLTVVDATPPGGGATVFRPPYVGTDKPYYYVADLHTELLPSFLPVDDTPTLEWVKQSFERVQLDHKGGLIGRNLHPVDNIPDYGADIGRRNGDGALRLMLNDPLSAKMPALIAYMQYGIDLYHMVLDGQTWPDGGGHRPGQKLPLTFAATLLDHQGMKDVVARENFYHEDKVMWYSPVAGHTLYGSDQDFSFELLEQRYWEVVVSYIQDGSASGYKSYSDPYGYIDGGYVPGTSYQLCCTTQPWKGEVLSLYLMPEMKSIWHTTAIYDYIDRWVNFGAWSQPDPCAPAEANWDNYGVTFGPAEQGGCILDTNPDDGIGRFPERHGEEADGGGRYSHFQAAMWDAYRYAGALDLRGTPGNQTIFLEWGINETLPPTSTWTIQYESPGSAYLPVTGILSPTRAYTLTDLTNGVWYTITLHAMLDSTSLLSDTVHVMPVAMDHFIYLPLVLK